MPAPGVKKRARVDVDTASLSEAQAAAARTDQAMSVLLTTLRSSQDEVVLSEAISTLREYFVEKLLDEGVQNLKSASADTDAEACKEGSAAWCREKYLEFRTHLQSLLGKRSVPSTVQCPALHALMECVRVEQPGKFANELYWDTLRSALTGDQFSSELLGVLAGGYLVYADVRYHTWSAVRRIAEAHARADAGAEATTSVGQDASAEDVVRNLYDVMANMPLVFETLDLNDCAEAEKTSGVAAWCLADGARDFAGAAHKAAKSTHGGRGANARPKWSEVKEQKQVFSKAWLALLQLQLPDDIYRKVLGQVHTAVIPHMMHPVLLADFLTKSIDRRGLAGMLALNGIFVLVASHGLEYPQFYDRLYSLLEAPSFHTRYRKRFFDLMDVFLKSPLLPAYIGAAFAKRFARLALVVPPSGQLVAMTFIHNLLRRHPSCSVLVHREQDTKLEAAFGTDVADQMLALDPFLHEVDLPAKSKALKSSLWELAVLQNSLYPQVVEFAKVLNKDLTDRHKTSELNVHDVTAYSYLTLLDEELARKMKRCPLAYYPKVPTALMDEKVLAPSFPGWNLAENAE